MTPWIRSTSASAGGFEGSGGGDLYFTEEVDEFVAQILHTYKDKEFRSAMDGASDESAQEKAKEEADTHKDVLPS